MSGVTSSTPSTYTRDGLDRTAARVREEAAKSGQTMTHEEARRRVNDAVRRTPVNGTRG